MANNKTELSVNTEVIEKAHDALFLFYASVGKYAWVEGKFSNRNKPCEKYVPCILK